MIAYRNDPALKADLIDALNEPARLPLITLSTWSQEAELVAWADEVGLPAALVLLTAHLVVEPLHAPPALQFARDVIGAIEPGAQAEAAAHLWTIWALESAPEPLGAMLTAPDLQHAASEIAELHRSAAAGVEIERGRWRAARAAVARLATDGDKVAQAVAAAAWDYRATPGAVVDLLGAWDDARETRIRDRLGWTEADDKRLLQIRQDQMKLAEERLGPAPDSDKADHLPHARRLVAEMQRLIDGLGDPISGRHAQMSTATARAAAELRDQARAALVAILRSPASH
ncbi:MAG TPA: hypothetical protein VHW60_08675 [Caulobacteraceae bacterium]|nr:hypothetical protein [Caulobacteraceae bacterium]